MSKIILGTSISPNNIEKQRYAIRTWIENGFEVISCNVREEILAIKPHFHDMSIEFVEVEKTAYELVGKPLPYMKDILEVIKERSAKICGYSNSDIVMPKIEKGMYRYIYEEAENSLIFTHRYEIRDYNDIEEMNCQIHFDGIDLFFLDKKYAANIFDYDFFVQSSWDLCLLTKCKILDITVKELINPIAFHVRHSVQWDSRTYDITLKNFWSNNFLKCENVYEVALSYYYSILYDGSEQICFLNKRENKCLFVIEEYQKEMIDTIKMQDYPNISIANTDKDGNMYDFIIYMQKGVSLSKAFCKSVIYLLERYKCSELKMGRFYTSKVDGKMKYNEINRNISLLKEINEKYNLYIKVKKNKKNTKSKKVLIPLVREFIDIYDKNTMDYIEFSEKMYIMPSGVRACERYQVYKNKIKPDIVCGFIDNNRDKWGKVEDGISIYSLKEVLQKENEFSIIIASKYYYKEIEEQLHNMLCSTRIYNDGLILYIDNKGVVYYFNLEKYRKNCEV